MSDKQTDICTCGHSRATHFEHSSQACSCGDCICAQFDKVDPLREAAPAMLAALEKIASECGMSASSASLMNDKRSLQEFADLQHIADEAIRKAKGQ